MIKNTRANIASTISVLLGLFLSLDLSAQAITMAPAAIWIQKLNQELKKAPYKFQKTSTLNLSLPEGKVVSEQVNLSGQFQISNLQPELEQLKLSLNINDAEVLAKNVQIHFSINQDLGFGSATINLNAACRTISIKLKSAQSLTALVDKGLQVTQLVENIPRDAIETTLSGCTSIAGLDQAIQDKVIEYVRTQLMSNQFHKILSDEIANQLNQKLDTLAKLSALNGLAGLQTRIHLDEKFRIWSYVGENAETLFSADELNSIADSNKFSVLIKKDFLEQSIRSYVNQQIIEKPIFSKVTPGMQRLTCSRWAQFFVWPSLSALPKCFDMKLSSKVKDLKIVDLKNVKFSMQVESWVQAPDQNKDIAYFKSAADFSLSAMQAQVTAFSGQQYPQFLDWSKRSAYLSISPLKSAVQVLLTAKLTEIKNSKDKGNFLLGLKFENVKSVKPDSISFQVQN